MTAREEARGAYLARRRAFLRQLAACANVTHAARAAGKLNRSALYKARRRLPAFARAWDAALAAGLERTAAEARRLAGEDWLEPDDTPEDDGPVRAAEARIAGYSERRLLLLLKRVG